VSRIVQKRAAAIGLDPTPVCRALAALGVIFRAPQIMGRRKRSATRGPQEARHDARIRAGRLSETTPQGGSLSEKSHYRRQRAGPRRHRDTDQPAACSVEGIPVVAHDLGADEGVGIGTNQCAALDRCDRRRRSAWREPCNHFDRPRIRQSSE
jgi:hypothetical protein